MVCCLPPAGFMEAPLTRDERAAQDARSASRQVGDGLLQTDFSVPGIHCGGCIRRIELELGRLPGVESCRVNLSNRRVAVLWREGGDPPQILTALAGLGYQAHLHDEDADPVDAERTRLLRALAVAAFASSNIMLLSVAVWSGADNAARDALHLISAVIALPAILYAGRIFFASAWAALRHGRTNMDVPISIGILLAFALSLHESLTSGPHAYFDAAVSLIFFLLIGRTLDHLMRDRARTAVRNLARLSVRGAFSTGADGMRLYRLLSEIVPGMTVHLAAGERVPVDGHVITGHSQIDASLVTGEMAPVSVGPGDALQAGTLNLTGPLDLAVSAPAEQSFLAEIRRLMEAAEAGRGAYRRIADRASAIYAPAVHILAAATFAGWAVVSGNIHMALTTSIAVLIVTCPCALGLAVPMVHVAAARRLFEAGILVKDGSALERLADVDAAVFDKTGTLTEGRPRLISAVPDDPTWIAVAAAIAVHSRHPYAQALAATAGEGSAGAIKAGQVREYPGNGLEARCGKDILRLGRAAWALAPSVGQSAARGTVLSRNGQCVVEFTFDQPLRDGAAEAIDGMRDLAIPMQIVSGDAPSAVEKLADMLQLPYVAAVSPAGKAAHITGLRSLGRKVLMVGDGLNDAPSLVAAHASIAPATAADVGRAAADFVFLRESLLAVPLAVRTAREAARLVRQNFILAIAYNLIAVPIAVMGELTPLLAALAMSGSSVLVVANALRLKSGARSSAEMAL